MWLLTHHAMQGRVRRPRKPRDVASAKCCTESVSSSKLEFYSHLSNQHSPATNLNMATGFSFTPLRGRSVRKMRTPLCSSDHIREHAQLSVRLSTFENLGHLGTGSFSDVFKVYDSQNHRLYALKRSRKAMRTEKAMRDALNEVKVMRKLNALCGQSTCSTTEDDEKEEVDNVNIVRFERHWLTADGRLFQIFEFCEHGTLRQLIQSNAQSTPLQTLQCVRQICCGLEIVHSSLPRTTSTFRSSASNTIVTKEVLAEVRTVIDCLPLWQKLQLSVYTSHTISF